MSLSVSFLQDHHPISSRNLKSSKSSSKSMLLRPDIPDKFIELFWGCPIKLKGSRVTTIFWLKFILRRCVTLEIKIDTLVDNLIYEQ